MVRIGTISLVFAALLSPGVCLGIEQTQSTEVGVGDHILLQQGLQAGDVLQNLAIFNEQVIEGACGQGLLVNVAGIGHASSEAAEVGVLRSLDLMGWQGQLVTGPCMAKREDQNLGLYGMLSIGMHEGPGQGDALQQFVVQGDQGAGNFNGTMGSTTSVLGLQNAALAGMARALDGAETRMQVDTVQSQLSP
jgi:hypothetical protein